jgi:hypothetical protein
MRKKEKEKGGSKQWREQGRTKRRVGRRRAIRRQWGRRGRARKRIGGGEVWRGEEKGKLNRKKKEGREVKEQLRVSRRSKFREKRE